MGDKADDILGVLALNKADQKKYSAVQDAFEKYFVCKHNVMYERAQFNKRCKQNLHFSLLLYFSLRL